MKAHINFRKDIFRGSLRELLEESASGVQDYARLVSAHEWLKSQLHQPDNILPVRRFAKYPIRGKLHPMGRYNSSFMPCDNEPLADLYRRWIEAGEMSGTIGQALVSGDLVASWKCDQGAPAHPSMKFRGVRAQFRERGLKLAHIVDAAKGFRPSVDLADQVAIRFLRTLSPLNIFLFPSSRCCEFRLISGKKGWHPACIDWCEDIELRRIAMAWLLDSLGQSFRDALRDFAPSLEPLNDWRRVSEETIVEVQPRTSFVPDREEARNPRRPVSKAKSRFGAFRRIPKSDAVTVQDAANLLREWRLTCPNATRLDGRIGSNPDHWVHVRVDGYENDDGYRSRYGVTFRGSDYNGIVNFHGDTGVRSIDRFIELIDAAEDSHDVLRPSATHETREKPPKAKVKPKFALQGFEDKVEGFYLYHDEWR